MGWKNVRDYFGITQHRIEVEDGAICIGNGFIHDQIKISTSTGAITTNRTFPELAEEKYPALCAAKPEELLKLIQSPDTFKANIPVYTFKDGEIIDCLCEEPGYPNLTHDGRLMHENRFSTDRNQVVAWAKRDLECWQKSLGQSIEKTEADLRKQKRQYADVQERLEVLARNYPDTAAEHQ